MSKNIDDLINRYAPDTENQGIDSLIEKYQAAPKKYGIGEATQDLGVAALKGGIAVGQGAAGLANILTGGLSGEALKAVGYDSQATNQVLNNLHTDQYKQGQQAVQEAGNIDGSEVDKGLNTLGALIANPMQAVGTAVESLPLMLPGLGLQSKLYKAGASMPAIIGAGAGMEGLQATGSIADQAQQAGRNWSDYALPALAGGAVTGAIAQASGMGLGDVAASLIARKGFSPLRGAVTEGLVEELPQSVNEQIATNVAMGEPDIWKGTGAQGVQGAVAGGLMGVGMGSAGILTRAANQVSPNNPPLERGTEGDLQDKFTEKVNNPVQSSGQKQQQSIEDLINRFGNLNQNTQNLQNDSVNPVNSVNPASKKGLEDLPPLLTREQYESLLRGQQQPVKSQASQESVKQSPELARLIAGLLQAPQQASQTNEPPLLGYQRKLLSPDSFTQKANEQSTDQAQNVKQATGLPSLSDLPDNIPARTGTANNANQSRAKSNPQIKAEEVSAQQKNKRLNDIVDTVAHVTRGVGADYGMLRVRNAAAAGEFSVDEILNAYNRKEKELDAEYERLKESGLTGDEAIEKLKGFQVNFFTQSQNETTATKPNSVSRNSESVLRQETADNAIANQPTATQQPKATQQAGESALEQTQQTPQPAPQATQQDGESALAQAHFEANAKLRAQGRYAVTGKEQHEAVKTAIRTEEQLASLGWSDEEIAANSLGITVKRFRELSGEGETKIGFPSDYVNSEKTAKIRSKTIPSETPANNGKSALAQNKKPKQGTVKETDELLTAIAKLGGLNRAEAIAQGIDPAMLNKRTKNFGKNAVFTQKGRSYDDIQRSLSQYGFNFNDDLNILVDAVHSAVNTGEKFYTPAGWEKAMEDEAIAKQEGLNEPEKSLYDDALAFFDEHYNDKPLTAEELAALDNSDYEETIPGFDNEQKTQPDARANQQSNESNAQGQTTNDPRTGRTTAKVDNSGQDLGFLSSYTEQEIKGRAEREKQLAEAERQANLKAEQKRKADLEVDTLADEMLGNIGTVDAFSPLKPSQKSQQGSGTGDLFTTTRGKATAPKEAVPNEKPAPVVKEKLTTEQAKYSIDDIDQRLASNAFYWTSFDPEKRGESARQSYVSALETLEKSLKQQYEQATQEQQQAFDNAFGEVVNKFKELYKAYLVSHSNVASTMIAGPANFNTERNRKRSDAADNKQKAAYEYLEKAQKRLEKIFKGQEDNSLEGQLKAQEQKLEQLKANHERMKAANIALRKNDDAKLKELGFTDEQITELKTPYLGSVGYQKFTLTNNLANIKRVEDQIATIKKRISTAQKAESTTETEQESLPFKMVQNTAENRLQLFFDGKPDEETRNLLKAAAFKWSPKNMAWQRQLTANAIAAANQIAEKIKTNLPKYSQTTAPANAHTATSLKTALSKIFGQAWLNRLLSTGKFKIISRADAARLGVNNNAQAFYNPKDDSTYFVSENIDQSKDLKKLMLHELGVHALQLGKTTPEFEQILKQLNTLIKRRIQSKELKAAIAAAKNANTPEHLMAEEVAGYLVEFHPQLSLSQKIIAFFRNMLRKLGLLNGLNEADIVFMAHSALRTAPESLLFNGENKGELRYNKKSSTEDEDMKQELLQKMASFGVSEDDIDENGYITLYHGGKSLPKTVKAGDIFFLTNSYDTAADYAQMRKGKVFELKVKPQDVSWNTGSYEIEIEDGGKIQSGVFTPKVESKNLFVSNSKAKENSISLNFPKTSAENAKPGDYVTAISGIGYWGANPIKVIENTGKGLKLEGKPKKDVFSYGQFELTKQLKKDSSVSSNVDAALVKNSGTFDPNNNDIRYSIASDVKDFFTGQPAQTQTLGDILSQLNTGKPKTKPKDAQYWQDFIVENLTDISRPFDRWVMNTLPSEIASRLIGAKDRAHGMKQAYEKEAVDKFGRDISEAIRAIAKETKMKFQTAKDMAGYWMSAVYAPEANDWLLQKDQKAIDALEQEKFDLMDDFNAIQNPSESSRAKLDAKLDTLDKQIQEATDKRDKRKKAIERQEFVDLPQIRRDLVELRKDRTANATEIARLEAILAENQGLAGGMNNFTANEIKTAIEKVIPKDLLKTTARPVYALLKWKLENDLKDGKVSQKTVDGWNNSPNYVPLTGDPRTDDSMEDSFILGDLNVQKDYGIEGRTGSIAQNAIDATFEQVQKSARYHGWNEFKEEFHTLYNRLLSERMAEGLTQSEAIKEIREEYGINRRAADTQIPPGDNDIVYRKDNKGFIYTVDNAAAMQALKGMNQESVPSILKPFGWFTSLQAKMVTVMMLGFAPTNTLRDVLEKSENLRTRKIQGLSLDMNQVANDALKNSARLLTRWKVLAGVLSENTPVGRHFTVDDTDIDTQQFKDFLRLGGNSAYGDVLKNNPQDLSKQLAKLGTNLDKAAQYIYLYNGAWESISGFSIYQSLIKHGVPKEQAAETSLNLMNFRKRGKLLSPLRTLYMFINPTMQGAHQLTRSLKTPRGRMRLMAYTAAAAMLYAFLRSGDDDDDGLYNKMDEQPNWSLYKNILIPLPNGEYFKIPVGFGMQQLALGMGVNLVRTAAGSMTVKEMLSEAAVISTRQLMPVAPAEYSIADNPLVWMAQTLTPQPFKPMMNVALDRTAFNTPLTNQRYERADMSKSLQGRKQTAQEYKDLAQWLASNGIVDMYPEQLRELIRGYFIGHAGDVIKLAIENPNAEKLGRAVVSPFFDRWISASSDEQIKERFYYRLRDKMNEAMNRRSLGEPLSPEERRLVTIGDKIKPLEGRARGKFAAATRAEKQGHDGKARNLRNQADKIRERYINYALTNLQK